MGEHKRLPEGQLLVPDGRLVSANGVPLTVKHYALVLIEQGRVRDRRALHDPFVRVQLRVVGWRKAWQVLRGGYTLEVQVVGDEDAYRAVFGPSALIRP